jgi:hypothetical protein
LILSLFAASVCTPQTVEESGTGLAGEVLGMGCSSFKAKILLINLRSLETQTTESSREFGAFAFPDLKPGDYAVIVGGIPPCIPARVRQVKITEGKVTRLRIPLLPDENCHLISATQDRAKRDLQD